MNYKLAFALGLIPPGVVGREQWETVFEGTVTTVKPSVSTQSGYEYRLDYFGDVVTGATYRLTVDGVTVGEVTPSAKAILVGNLWLYFTSTMTDDGGDFALVYDGNAQLTGRRFLSRTPDTYTVKIERSIS